MVKRAWELEHALFAIKEYDDLSSIAIYLAHLAVAEGPVEHCVARLESIERSFVHFGSCRFLLNLCWPTLKPPARAMACSFGATCREGELYSSVFKTLHTRTQLSTPEYPKVAVLFTTVNEGDIILSKFRGNPVPGHSYGFSDCSYNYITSTNGLGCLCMDAMFATTGGDHGFLLRRLQIVDLR